MTVMGRHEDWRKLAKKLRRKNIRQKIARKRDEDIAKVQRIKERSVEYQIWMAEQEKMEAFRKSEEERICDEENEKWLRAELLAQQQWRLLQEKIRKARLERAEQDLRIKKEWDDEQRKIKEAEETRKQLEAERLQQHQELMRRIEMFVSGSGELPSELLVGRETNPGKEVCPFFSKTGACRFNESCSRNHKYPGISKIVVACNFYTNFGMEHSRQNEHGDDINLEFDDKDVYSHYEEFFNDVFPEFQKMGRIVQFKVCLNHEKHLRGNTYVEYSSLAESLNAYRTFHGRWYGGKQMSLQFCEITSWKRAICGLFSEKKCPKGRSCNFLHVFKNPNNLFGVLDDRYASTRSDRNEHRTHSRHRNRAENWRWSESPVRHINGDNTSNRRDSHDRSESSKTSSHRSERHDGSRSETRYSSKDRHSRSSRRSSRDRSSERRSRSKENVDKTRRKYDSSDRRSDDVKKRKRRSSKERDKDSSNSSTER